jgi:hypothetical protein
MKQIEGGQEGIQYISKGSQQFATESNFLFMTTNESKQSFHVKTGGGIILENKKNKVYLQENGARLDVLYLEENITGDSMKVIGGNYLFQMKEKKNEYHLQMNSGLIKHTNFSKFEITGDIFEVNVAKFLVKRGDYGIDWENDLIVSNPSQIKFMSLNGDINFSTKNGERIVFENKKPNGIIEFRGERSLIKTELAKMEHQTLQINCPKIQINKSIFVEDNSLEIISGVIQLKGDKMEIGCIKMREGSFMAKTDNIIIGAMEDNKIEITNDKISIIGDGKIGIMMAANKGGIKMLGNLQWNHLEDTIIETDDFQKILRIGEKSWKLKLDGNVEIEDCTIIGKNKRISGEFCEIVDDSLITWQIGNNLGRINLGGILFESGVNKLEINNECIKESGRLKCIEIGILEEIGLHKMQNWDKLEEKGLEKKSELELLENQGGKKRENWKKVEEEIGDYCGAIQGKYELCFGEANGLYWDGGAEEFVVKGVFKKNNRHIIFGDENKLIFENNEIEIRNCLRWKDNELLIGVGKRLNNIFLTEEIILLGGKTTHLAIFENKINLGDVIQINSDKQIYIGELVDKNKSKEKKIVIGLDTSSLFINEKQVYMQGKKVCFIGTESIRIQSKSIGIGFKETEYIEFVGAKMVYKKGWSQIEWDESFVFTRDNGGSGSSSSKFYVGERGVFIDSDDLNFKYGVHIKAPINLHSTMGNIMIDSTIGDIQIKNNGCQIFMSKDDKLLGIWGENNILIKGKKLVMDVEKMEANTKNIGFDVKTDIYIQYGRKLEIIGGREIEFQSKDGIKLVSGLFGEIKIGEKSEINIQKSLNLEVGGNYLVDIDGEMEYKIGKSLKIFGKNIVNIVAEDEINIKTGGGLWLECTNIGMKSSKIIIEASEEIELSGDKLTMGAKGIIFQQRGFGEMSWEADGKMRIVSKLEGNRGDVMEILAESNTHEKSVHICSRIGGIYLEGQTIGLGGKVHINGVEIVGGDNRLMISGMVEVPGLKIGKNMFIEPRGISLLQREEVELRNMDLKLGGRLDTESLKVKKILGGAEVEGKMRVIGGIECKGGIVGDGVRLGNWDGGNRSCLKIDMKGTVWNEGINISGGGRSIVVDGDIVCAGGGRILAHCPREGREGGGGRDIGKLLEEVAAMGESGTLDVGRALQKLAAIVGILAVEKEE